MESDKYDKGSIFAATMSFCNKCKHNNRDGSCKAFEVIPDKFMFDVLHSEIVSGQKGNFVFTEG